MVAPQVQTLLSLVNEVEDAVGSRDADRRVAMLRRMTDLFTDEVPRISETQVGAFDEVMVRLSTAAPIKARAELAERLAGIGLAPRKVVRDLAYDESLDVAGPVLQRSTRLDEGDLVKIAQARGQDHLYVIAQRTSLSERLTDVLVTRGDQKVVRSVAGNEGARFSDFGFGVLTERAADDTVLESTLQTRADLPGARMAQLAERSRARIAARLAQTGAAPAPTPGRPVPFDARPTDEALAAAIAFVEGRGRGGQGLGYEEEDVLAWVREGRVLEALVALSRAAGVPVPVALRAHRAAHHDPLLFLVRSVRYGWGTLKALLMTKLEGPPSIDTLTSAQEAFRALSVATAQRVVRFTAVREQAQESSAA